MKSLRKFLLLTTYVRYKDAIIGQALTVGGLAFFIPALTLETILRGLTLTLGSFLLMAFVFSVNDWADIGLDERNPQKSAGTFLHDGIRSREMLLLAAVLAASGLLAVFAVSRALVPVAILIVCLGLAYSFPIRGLRGKGIPILSSCLHFIGTVLTFLLGSMAFAPVNARTLWIASYFGVLITAGHLVQEVQDHEFDGIAGVQTNAVRFGARQVFRASFVIFTLSFVFLFFLTRAGIVPDASKYAIVLYPIYVLWAIRTYRAGLGRDDVQRFRNRYRILFGLVALVIWVTAFIGRAPAG